jgi:peptidoglycan/xylan/chitin deacetylase (PgdA/CDA1 family)
VAAVNRLHGGAALVVGALLTVAALAVPAYAYLWASAEDVVADRHGAPEPSWGQAELEDLLASAPEPAMEPAGPLILAYHNVLPDPAEHARYTVTPQQLADHFALLAAMGYTTITGSELVEWLDGERDLPPRSVLLTFDDGASGLWRYADAVLEAFDFHGVVFAITGRVGTHRPYYLTWQEIDRLQRSGRWDIESHTRLGHDQIPVDRAGGQQPSLISRRWIADEGRRESPTEFATRVREDLQGSIDDLAARGLGGAGLFSYPFSAETNSTAELRSSSTTSDIASDLFEATMTNAVPDRAVSERDRRRRELPRLEIFRSTTVEALHTRLLAATPIPPGPRDPLADPALWTDTGGEPLRPPVTRDVDQGSELVDLVRFDEAAASATLLPPEGGYVGATLTPGRSTDWIGYRAQVTVNGLGADAGGPTGSLFALWGSEDSVQVAVSANYVRVNQGTAAARRIVYEGGLPTADERTITVEVRPTEVLVLLDGWPVTRVDLHRRATGGVAIAASNGPVTFTSMQLGAIRP